VGLTSLGAHNHQPSTTTINNHQPQINKTGGRPRNRRLLRGRRGPGRPAGGAAGAGGADAGAGFYFTFSLSDKPHPQNSVFLDYFLSVWVDIIFFNTGYRRFMTD
jgi:hypothetical protein